MKKLLSLLLLAPTCLSFFLVPPKEHFTMKKFKKKLSMIEPGLYAGKYEVTNFEYNEFLKSVEQEYDKEMMEKIRIHNENWNMDKHYNEPFVKTYHKHPAFAQYPVVTISNEGAAAFCQWLTNNYNAYPKRKFKKVKFKLPTEEEWVLAARGGNEAAIYPWGSYSLRNKRGDILANFTFVPERLQKGQTNDGSIMVNAEDRTYINSSPHMAAPSHSYLPNNFGLYNLSGNVAEMLSEPGHTKGGSWASYGYYLRIDAEDEFAGFEEPSPKIGFRYFMEVIEE